MFCNGQTASGSAEYVFHAMPLHAGAADDKIMSDDSHKTLMKFCGDS